MMLNGEHSQFYFKEDGSLRNITKLNSWPLKEVLVDKYEFDEPLAAELSKFLLPMLTLVPYRRITAEKCLESPWLANVDPNDLNSVL